MKTTTLKALAATAGAMALATVARAQLTPAWSDVYDGATHGYEYSLDSEIDSAGNLYVVGSTEVEIEPGVRAPAFLTIKYSTNGARLWVRTLTPAGGDGQATRVALDAQQRPVIAGNSGFSGQQVVKYDAEGNALWSGVYLPSLSSLAAPAGLGVDTGGNVYLLCPDSAAADGLALARWDAGGQFLGATVFDHAGLGASPGGLTVNRATGECYVAGSATSADGHPDFAVMKFSAAGQHLWTRIMPSVAAAGSSKANAVAIDPQGNIIAAGSLDFASGITANVGVMKLTPGGSVVWTCVYDSSPTADDTGDALAVDPFGNVYVAGRNDSGVISKAQVVKISAGGAVLWAAAYSGAAGSTSVAADVGTDSAGAPYMTGRHSAAGSSEFFTVKYSASGSLLTSATWVPPFGLASWATRIAVDPRGSVFATGNGFGTGTGQNALAIKYTQALPACVGDVSGDAAVTTVDLAALLGSFGTAGPGGDVNGDGVVNTADLLLLLGVFGQVCR